MVDRKGIGWVPDYPDVRDYDVTEIDSKLRPKLEDIQINNDPQDILTQNILDQILNLLDQLHNNSDNKKSVVKTDGDFTQKIDEIKKQISGNFKLVKATSVKEQTFLAVGSVSYQVYDLQIKLLRIYEDIKKFGDPKNVIKDLIDSLKDLEEVFYIDQAIEKSHYIECGYFGEFTKKAINEFKKTFKYSDDDIVDTVTIEKLDQILKTLESEISKPEESEISKRDSKVSSDSNKRLKLLTKIIESLTEDSDEKSKYSDPKNDYTNLPMLKIGSRDENVKYLQELLIRIKEFPSKPTEYFELPTQQAIINFQIKYKLTVDGIVGQQTWRILHELVNIKIQSLQPLVITHYSPIPVQLYDIILNIFQISDFSKIKELSEFSADKLVNQKEFLSQIDAIDHRQQLKQTIELIVQLVAQILSPLAKHQNLENAVINVFQQLDKWFNGSGEINCLHKQKSSNKQIKSNSSENIEAIIKDVFWKFQQQTSTDNSSNIPRKIEQKNDLFKEWDANPESLYLAVSTILNFKQALKNIPDTITDESDKKRALAFVEKSIKKIDDIFKSIKDLESKDLFKQQNDRFPCNKQDDQLSQTNEENGHKIQQQTIRTVVKIIPENLSKELEEQPNFQVDLQLPIEWNLHKSIQKQGKATYVLMPEFVDLSFWCSPIENQGLLDSCTAHAGVALIEYFEKRSFDNHLDASRLFLYKVTRNLMHRQGDVGASLRETMKAMALFGVPPEDYWPYEEDKSDEEPTPFCYSFAQSYQALKYFRLNPVGTTSDILLCRIKAALAAGLPCAFGFTVYNSIDDNSNPRGYIPYPVKTDKVKGGHAVVAVGYDDHKLIKNADSKVSPGALLIRNSWGTNWGEEGYGWLPYEYILKGLTADWWSLLKSEWFETGKFGLGATDKASSLGIEDRTTPPESHESGSNG